MLQFYLVYNYYIIITKKIIMLGIGVTFFIILQEKKMVGKLKLKYKRK